MTDVDTAKELPTVLSFCSGYGGIERGLDLAGFKHRVIAFSEIEAYAIANLANKMERGELLPAPIWSNLKTLPVQPFRDKVDLLTSGYPCQPFSAAGKRLGEDDPRHLWPYIRRHIESIRPVRVFFENVEGHISLGLREVISDLESLGYKTTWGIFSAREVGAPHQRKRVYILAYSKREQDNAKRPLVKSGWERLGWQAEATQRKNGKTNANSPYRCGIAPSELADSISERPQGGLSRWEDTERKGKFRHFGRSSPTLQWRQKQGWPPEPRLGRVVDGCADRVDRIRLLGNGVVPQTAAKAWITLNKRIEALND